MPDTFDHHPWTVTSLVDAVQSGRIRLPDLQRPFVWANSKVRDLIDSMYRGFPVGQLMLWEVPSASHGDDSQTRNIGTGAKSQPTSLLVIDGQQRLTALFAIFTGEEVLRDNYERDKIVISFNPLTQRFAVPDSTTRRSADWIQDVREIFEAPIRARKAYVRQLNAARGEDYLDEEGEERVEEAIDRVHQIGRYEFQAVQIKPRVARETVADIFVRINSEGVQLKSADFILTWLSVFWEEGRSALDDFSRNSRLTPTEISNETGEKTTWSPRNPYLAVDPQHLLRVALVVGNNRARLQDAYNALRGRDSRTLQIVPENRERELAKLKMGVAQTLKPNNWDEFLKVIERAGARNKGMITSTNAFLYTYALWLIGRTEFKVPIAQLRELMARWYFMVQITGRFSGSPETRAQEELNRLEGLPRTPEAFVEVMSAQVKTTLTTDWWEVTLPDELHTSNAYGPAYMAYIAALNILDADVLLSNLKVRDWFSPDRATVKGLEKHHLFPRAYLRSELKITTTRSINQVANQALVEWSDNVSISDKAPSEYWHEEVQARNIGAERLAHQMWWHALPEGWTDLKYNDFLEKRRRRIAQVTREGFKKLSDPNYTPGPMQLQQETHGKADFATLVLDGLLPVGIQLVPADGRTHSVAETTEDGMIRLNDVDYRTPTEAAAADGAGEEDGWLYWQALTPQPVLLSELRESASVDRQIP